MAQVEPRHVVPAGGQFRHQPARATGRFHERADGEIAILAAGGLDEVGFRLGIRIFPFCLKKANPFLMGKEKIGTDTGWWIRWMEPRSLSNETMILRLILP